MLSAQDVQLEIGGRVLVREATFFIAPGDKVGLVGRNGAGKSSLLSYLLGAETQPHLRVSGEVKIAGSIGYLPQVPVPKGLGTDPSAFSHVLSARGLDAIDEQLHQAREEMASDPTAEVIERFSHLEERYRNEGGYEVEGVIARLAEGIGLHQDLLMSDVDSLSGGQRRRVDLIRVLFQQPDLMILDEPTNHLDVGAKRWLMEELDRFTGTILIVSHDLKLLDRSINKVLYLADGTVREFNGNYSSYQSQFSADVEQREKASAMEEKEIKRMSQLADSMRHSTAGRARKAKVLDRKVERMQGDRTETIKRERKVTFNLPEPERSGIDALKVDALAVRYDAKQVLKKVGFSIARGERIAIVGRNGAGKSSLLRCLAGVQVPTEGSVVLGYNVALGYFAQEHEQLDDSRNALEHFDDKLMPIEGQRRALLGSFGIAGKTAYQRPSTLSGGERAKLSLAILASGKCNLLILDEPTNNLDPASVEAVGTMLSRWSGTIVAVSHDRPFVEALEPTHCLHLPAERYDLWREEFLDDVEMR